MDPRIAALYDIHGNLPALEAVLGEVRQAGVDQVIVGGDVVPGPMPAECLGLLLDLDIAVSFISGNGEREVLAEVAAPGSSAVPEPFREAVAWVAQQLDPAQADRMRGWPATLRTGVRGLGEALFCHATPRSDSEIFTRLTPAAPLLPVFAECETALVICGHTHMPFDRRIGDVRVVNAGSVGMPFGERGASWLVLGPDVEFRRTSYDPGRAVARIADTAYPGARAFATRYVLEPPTEQDMLALFGKAEIR